MVADLCQRIGTIRDRLRPHYGVFADPGPGNADRYDYHRIDLRCTLPDDPLLCLFNDHDQHLLCASLCKGPGGFTNIMMGQLPQVTIEYIRPGKDITEYVEDLLFEDEHCIKTFKEFPGDVAKRLTLSLQGNGFISKGQRTACITKVYFFHEYFNVLQ